MPTTGPDRRNLWFDTAGEAGSPVLLIMGYGMAGSAWQFQIPALSQAHRVVWYDHRGVGRSAPLERNQMTMPELAQDALGVLGHLGWEDAHIVGVSMGGMVAQHLALLAPHRVRSLTLIATHAGGLRNVLPPRQGLGLFLRANAARGQRRGEALAKLLYPEAFIAKEKDFVVQSLISDFSEPPPPRTRIAHLSAIVRHNTSRQLHRLDGLPTIIMRPGQDKLIDPRQSDRLHRLMPNASMVHFADAGHGLIRQSRHAVNRNLLELFHRVDAEIEPDARPAAVH